MLSEVRHVMFSTVLGSDVCSATSRRKCALDKSSALFSGEGVTSPMRPWEHARDSFPSPVVGNAAGRRPRASLRGQRFVLFCCASVLLLRQGRFVELGSGAQFIWSWTDLSGQLLLGAPGLPGVVIVLFCGSNGAT